VRSIWHFSWKNDRSERYAQIDLRSVHGKPMIASLAINYKHGILEV